jgi:hypothetical protein
MVGGMALKFDLSAFLFKFRMNIILKRKTILKRY